MVITMKLGSRAVYGVNDLANASCAGCGLGMTYRAKIVIANVYRRARWHHIERWHPRCYNKARPYGVVHDRKIRDLVKNRKDQERRAKCEVCKRAFITFDRNRNTCGDVCRDVLRARKGQAS